MADDDQRADLQRAFMEASGLDASSPVGVVGVSNYQDALTAIAGGQSAHVGEIECEAQLICEPTNPKDANAVAVYIGGNHVGYLPKGSVLPPNLAVRARIVGGWRKPRPDIRTRERVRFYGVVLWM